MAFDKAPNICESRLRSLIRRSLIRLFDICRIILTSDRIVKGPLKTRNCPNEQELERSADGGGHCQSPYALFHQLADPAASAVCSARTGPRALRRRVVQPLEPHDHLVDLTPSRQTRDKVRHSAPDVDGIALTQLEHFRG